MPAIKAGESRQAGLRAIRTASSVCIRSAKPPVQGQQYLDLYVLQRDRARWGQLKERAESMIRSIDKALNRLGLGPGGLLGSPQRVARGDLALRPQARRPTIVIRNRSAQRRQRRMEKVA